MQLFSSGFSGTLEECLDHFIKTELRDVERVDRGSSYRDPVQRYGFRSNELCQTLMFSNYSQAMRKYCHDEVFFHLSENTKRPTSYITLKGVISLMLVSKHPDCLVIQGYLPELLRGVFSSLFKNGHPVDSEYFQQTTGLFTSEY